MKSTAQGLQVSFRKYENMGDTLHKITWSYQSKFKVIVRYLLIHVLHLHFNSYDLLHTLTSVAFPFLWIEMQEHWRSPPFEAHPAKEGWHGLQLSTIRVGQRQSTSSTGACGRKRLRSHCSQKWSQRTDRLHSHFTTKNKNKTKTKQKNNPFMLKHPILSFKVPSHKLTIGKMI